MAYPFGGHVTFAEYLIWAQKQGLQVSSGMVMTPDGPETVTRIVNADANKWVIEAMDQREYLTATTVWRLDRRLGVTSPFISFPAEDEE